MTKNYTDDQELYGIMRQVLFTAVVGDVMDKSGLMHQFLPPEIQPLREDAVLAGRAEAALRPPPSR